MNPGLGYNLKYNKIHYSICMYTCILYLVYIYISTPMGKQTYQIIIKFVSKSNIFEWVIEMLPLKYTLLVYFLKSEVLGIHCQ